MQIHALLEKQDEKNWRRGIAAAIGELLNTDGSLNAAGFDNARSIYRTITTGGQGFAEYGVWKENYEERVAANRDLDQLRSRAWKVLG